MNREPTCVWPALAHALAELGVITQEEADNKIAQWEREYEEASERYEEFMSEWNRTHSWWWRQLHPFAAREAWMKS